MAFINYNEYNLIGLIKEYFEAIGEASKKATVTIEEISNYGYILFKNLSLWYILLVRKNIEHL